jgi:hypothetical protein
MKVTDENGKYFGIGILETEQLSPTKLKVLHNNGDDSAYESIYIVEGTEEEIKIIKEFCDRVDNINNYET